MGEKTCDNCGRADVPLGSWIGHGCGLCAAPSGYQHLAQWCERCIVRAQLAFAEKQAALVPELKARIDELDRERVRG